MMNINLPEIILTNLVKSDEYLRKTIPFLKEEYFRGGYKTLFEIILSHVNNYNVCPSIEALYVELENKNGLSQHIVDEARVIIGKIDNSDITADKEWLNDKSEEFCQDQAIFNALTTAISITENEKKDALGMSKGAIPKLFQDALNVSFDVSIGHDFFEDAEKRYDSHHTKSEKIAFNLEYFNKITNGGIEKKTLNIILGATGGGKSLSMCSFAADNLRNGKNVLYITLEMSEEKIAERIDANLLDININDISLLPKDDYLNKIEKLKSKIPGKLKIKEYPTTQAGSAHFRHLLLELRQKFNFVPDIIYIDYLNLCMSSRLKFTGLNSYNYVKAIAEEIRGLAIEFDVPIWSATQMNRSGLNDSGAGLEATSDSIGLPFTADFMVIIFQNEEMKKLNQMLIKQTEKNRYGDPNRYSKFIVGIDKNKMKLYNAEQSAQKDLYDDSGSVFDKSDFGEGLQVESKFDKNKFKNFV